MFVAIDEEVLFSVVASWLSLQVETVCCAVFLHDEDICGPLPLQLPMRPRSPWRPQRPRWPWLRPQLWTAQLWTAQQMLPVMVGVVYLDIHNTNLFDWTSPASSCSMIWVCQRLFNCFLLFLLSHLNVLCSPHAASCSSTVWVHLTGFHTGTKILWFFL